MVSTLPILVAIVLLLAALFVLPQLLHLFVPSVRVGSFGWLRINDISFKDKLYIGSIRLCLTQRKLVVRDVKIIKRKDTSGLRVAGAAGDPEVGLVGLAGAPPKAHRSRARRFGTSGPVSATLGLLRCAKLAFSLELHNFYYYEERYRFEGVATSTPHSSPLELFQVLHLGCVGLSSTLTSSALSFITTIREASVKLVELTDTTHPVVFRLDALVCTKDGLKLGGLQIRKYRDEPIVVNCVTSVERLVEALQMDFTLLGFSQEEKEGFIREKKGYVIEVGDIGIVMGGVEDESSDRVGSLDGSCTSSTPSSAVWSFKLSNVLVSTVQLELITKVMEVDLIEVAKVMEASQTVSGQLEKPTGTGALAAPLMLITSSPISLTLSVPSIFLMYLVTTIFLHHYAPGEVSAKRPRAKSRSSTKPRPTVSLNVPSVLIAMTIPNSQQVLFELDQLVVATAPALSVSILNTRLFVRDVSTSIPTGIYCRAVTLSHLTFTAQTLSLDLIRIFIPREFLVYKIIDNLVTLFKVVRQINYNCKQFRQGTLTIPLTIINPHPEAVKSLSSPLTIKAKTFLFTLADDPFEAELGEIYQLGKSDLIKRLTKMEMFERTAARILEQDRKLWEREKKIGLQPGEVTQENLCRLFGECDVQRTFSLFDRHKTKTKTNSRGPAGKGKANHPSPLMGLHERFNPKQKVQRTSKTSPGASLAASTTPLEVSEKSRTRTSSMEVGWGEDSSTMRAGSLEGAQDQEESNFQVSLDDAHRASTAPPDLHATSSGPTHLSTFLPGASPSTQSPRTSFESSRASSDSVRTSLDSPRTSFEAHSDPEYLRHRALVEAEIQEARYRLNAHFSKSWITGIRKAKHNRRERSRAAEPSEVYSATLLDRYRVMDTSTSANLFKVRFEDLSLGILPPEFDVWEFMKEKGGGQPVLDMTTLLAARLDMRASMVTVSVRDYPLPMVHFPSIVDGSLCDIGGGGSLPNSSHPLKAPGIAAGSSFHLTSPLCIGERLPLATSMRYIWTPFLSLFEGTHANTFFSLQTPRTLSPIKFYVDLEVEVASPSLILWGKSAQPAILYIAKQLDNFTKPPIDLLPKLSFWDKLRLIIHGRMALRFNQGLSLYIKGTHSPYDLAGTGLGMVFSWRDNVAWEVSDKGVEVKSREFVFGVPELREVRKRYWNLLGEKDSHLPKKATAKVAHPPENDPTECTPPSTSGDPSPEPTLAAAPEPEASPRSASVTPTFCPLAKTILAFSSPTVVSWRIGFLFQKDHNPLDLPFDPLSLAQHPRTSTFSPHWDINYYNPVFGNPPADAFRTFRSKYMHVWITVESAGDNRAYLTPGAVSAFKYWWHTLFSHSLKPREGNLFGGRQSSSRLPTMLVNLEYQLKLQPLVISHVFRNKIFCNIESEVHETAVGVKATIDEFEMDLHQVKEQVQLTTDNVPTPVAPEKEEESDLPSPVAAEEAKTAEHSVPSDDNDGTAVTPAITVTAPAAPETTATSQCLTGVTESTSLADVPQIAQDFPDLSGTAPLAPRALVSIHSTDTAAEAASDAPWKLKISSGSVTLTSLKLQLVSAVFNQRSLVGELANTTQIAKQSPVGKPNAKEPLAESTENPNLLSHALFDPLDYTELDATPLRLHLNPPTSMKIIPLLFSPALTYTRNVPSLPSPFPFTETPHRCYHLRPAETIQVDIADARAEELKALIHLLERKIALHGLTTSDRDNVKRLKHSLHLIRCILDDLMTHKEVELSSLSASGESEVEEEEENVARLSSGLLNIPSRELLEDMGGSSSFTKRFVIHDAQLFWGNEGRDAMVEFLLRVNDKRSLAYFMGREAVKYVEGLISETGGANAKSADTTAEAGTPAAAKDPESPKTAPSLEESDSVTGPPSLGTSILFISPQILLLSNKRPNSALLVTARSLSASIELATNAPPTIAVDLVDAHFYIINRSTIESSPFLFSTSSYGASLNDWGFASSGATGEGLGGAPSGFLPMEFLYDSTLLSPFRIISKTSLSLALALHPTALGNLYNLDLPSLALTCTNYQYNILYDVVWDLLLHITQATAHTFQAMDKLFNLSRLKSLKGLDVRVQDLQDGIRLLQQLKRNLMTTSFSESESRTFDIEIYRLCLELLLLMRMIQNTQTKNTTVTELHIRLNDFRWKMLAEKPLTEVVITDLYFTRCLSLGTDTNHLNIGSTLGKNLSNGRFPTLWKSERLDINWTNLGSVGGISGLQATFKLLTLMIAIDHADVKPIVNYIFYSPEHEEVAPIDDDIKEMLHRLAIYKRIDRFVIEPFVVVISFKGEKSLRFVDLRDLRLEVPSLEYSEKIWCSKELLAALKKDVVKILVGKSGRILGNIVRIEKRHAVPETIEDVQPVAVSKNRGHTHVRHKHRKGLGVIDES